MDHPRHAQPFFVVGQRFGLTGVILQLRVRLGLLPGERFQLGVFPAALLHKPLLLCNIDEIDGIPAMNAVRVYLRDPALEYPAIKLIRAARHIPAVRHISGKVFPFFQSFKRARTVVIEDVPIAVRNDDRIMQ